MIRKPISPLARLFLGISSICVVLGLYSSLSIRQHRINPRDTTIPNASQFRAGFQKITAAEDPEISWLRQDLQATCNRLAVGLLIGVVMSFVVGVAMGCFPAIEALLLPTVAFFARIPAIAMLSVYMVIFGIRSENIFYALVSLGIFPTLSQAIHQAAKKDVTEHAVYKAYTLGASQFEVIWEVVVRQILPRVIESIRLQIGPAMVLLIAAELLLADEGFGYRIRIQQRMLNMNVVFIYLVLLGIMGCLIEWGLYALRRWLCPWFGE